MTFTTFLGRSLRLAALAAATLVGVDAAQADMPGYWTSETFKTERSTFTASLSDESGEERRASRRSQPKRSVATSDDDDTPAPTRRRASREASESRESKPKRVRLASLGNSYVPAPSRPERSVGGGGGVRWVASSGCLNGTLRGVIAQVAARFGSVTVNSTCRSRSQNARAGGASRSMHLTGDAADFRVHGNWGAVSSFVRSMVGGFKHYGGGLFHIDTGERRSW